MAFLGAAFLLGVMASAQDISITKDGKPANGVGKGARLVPPQETLIEEKSLEFDSNARAFAPPEPGGDRANGAKFYAFELAPKERLSIQLKGESSNHLGMRTVRPVVPDEMKSQYERSDRVPKALRSSRFDIQNITEKPYTVVLMVYGTVNYWYKLAIERMP